MGVQPEVSRFHNIHRSKIIPAVIGIGVFTLALLSFGSTAFAADARNFNAGKIIDDGVFTNSSSMSVSQIQAFLESKVPNCDQNGDEPYAGTTRSKYAQSKGNPAKFTCLKSYKQNPENGKDNYGGKATPSGAISAAQIIYNYSKQFKINPQVILVTLQKENGMITDDWPFLKQYREAMGFGCPDNVAPGAPACDADYGSFSAQVYQAARHFRGYMDNNPDWWIPFTTGNNAISWSPKSSCGSKTVNIQNRATVALYSYTPYQPNAAAKNAQYGLGDSCSSYGNRNFYLYFTDWFGSTRDSVNVTSNLSVVDDELGKVYANDKITVKFKITNNTKWRVNVGKIGVAARSPGGETSGFRMKEVILDPKKSYTYTDTQEHFTEEGNYAFWIVSKSSDCDYCTSRPASISTAIKRKITPLVQLAPTITESLDASPDRQAKGGTMVASFKVKNNSAQPVEIGKMGVAIRDPDNKNVPSPLSPLTIAPGEEEEVTTEVKLPKAGKYTAWITNTKNNGETWNGEFPKESSDSIDRKITFTAKHFTSITEGISLSDATPHVGQEVALSFTISNFGQGISNAGKVGIAIRDPKGKNVGLAMVNARSIAPGDDFIYSKTGKFTRKGTYTAWITTTKDGKKWSRTSPASEDSTVVRKLTFTVN